ncbi:MAG TPA: MFS transporter, partial [Thermoleophilaceae bacterium]|nr:MFS transporter [Thermoleophilaceae bacterium]
MRVRRSTLREAAARARARTPLRRGAPPRVERGSAWAPLRHRQFRSLWTAQLVSNVGTWMQTVGAQWLMLSLDPSPLMVALVQTSISLPIVLLALPAGALGDVFDRRRVLMTSQAMMLVGAAVLAALTLAHAITAWSLLALTFSIGLGDALRRPTWQAIQPELVPRELIPQAAALNSTSVNLARALGPAIGGAVVAGAGPGWVFMANAASFLGVLGVLTVWRRERRQSALGPERIGAAVRAGARYARSSPRLRAVLARTALFLCFGSSLWALLPVAAHSRLGLGSGGYGLLLGSVGVGALLGAVTLPSLRERRSANAIVTGESLVFAAAVAALAWFAVVPVAVIALVAAGFAWIATVSSLNASVQTILPSWVRARGMALFLLVVQGGQALGSVAWGFVAEHSDVQVAFTAVAGGLVLGVAFGLRYPVRSGEDLDLTPSRHWREPELVIDRDPSTGPVLVTIEYRVPPENHEAFRDAMQAVGRSRRRSGAERWGLFQEATDPDRFVEAFVVPSWEEHLRQHE